jgi:hypothetical protein
MLDTKIMCCSVQQPYNHQHVLQCAAALQPPVTETYPSTPSPLSPMLPGSVDPMTGGSSSRCCRPDHVVHMLVHASDFHWIEVWGGEKRWRGVVLLVQWCCVTCVSVHIDNRFRGSSLLLCNFFLSQIDAL